MQLTSKTRPKTGSADWFRCLYVARWNLRSSRAGKT